MDIRIIQFSTDQFTAREQASSDQLKSLGLPYTRIENPVYDEVPPLDNIFQGDTNLYVGLSKEYHEFGLTPRHYGCWLGHKQAINLGHCENNHFLVCEGDCKILNIETFKDRLNEAIQILNNTEYPIVRFEEPNNGITTSFFNKVSDNFWECDKVNLGHCYLINKKSKSFFTKIYNDIGWHAFDWWISIAFTQSNQKMLCLKEKITTQFDGFSDIDKLTKRY